MMRLMSFLFVACLLRVEPVDGRKNKRQKMKRNFRERRSECQSVECGHLVPLEAKNCVNKCISSDCYKNVFVEPLEDGEVNDELSNSFTKCAQRELRQTYEGSSRGKT